MSPVLTKIISIARVESIDVSFQNVDDPGAQCYLHELRKILVEDFPADQRDEAARDVFGCHANLDKMSKAEVFSVMHWMLSLAP